MLTRSRIARVVLALVVLALLAVVVRWPVSSWLRSRENAAQLEVLDAYRAQHPPRRTPSMSSGSWPGFRGAGTRGTVPAGADVPEPPDTLRERFRRPVGAAHSGMAIADGRIFTMEQHGEQEAVTAYDLGTGAELWVHRYRARFGEPHSGDGPRATPTVADGRVYAMGAAGHLHALSAATGEVLWSHDVLQEVALENMTFGMCNSPLVVDGLLVAAASGGDGPGFIAYDAVTGEEKWTSEWMDQSHASPIVVTLGGVRQIVHMSVSALLGIEIATGDTLWSAPFETSGPMSAAQPVPVGDDRVFVSAASGKGSALIRVRAGEAWSTERVWSSAHMNNEVASSVVRDGVIYGLDDETLAAVRLSDGAPLWRGDGYGRGQLLWVGEHLLIQSDEGVIVWGKADAQGFNEVSRLRAVEGSTWTTPSVVSGALVVRNARELAVFESVR